MLKPGRFIFIILCLCLLAGIAPDIIPEAYADSSMTASESCIGFIRETEGFSVKPYYDYGQHTVGYGTKCPTDKYLDYMVNGIPKSEAEALLREAITETENAINKRLIDKYQLTLNQHQFDALVSFSFNVGIGWMSYDSTLKDAILRGATDDEMVYAFGLYCTAGGSYSSGLIARRLCESNMYLNGVYSRTKPDGYGYVYYEPNGGSLTYQVQAFIYDNHSLPAADAVRRNDVFLGWYTDLTGGTRVNELSDILSGKTLFARWQSSENTAAEDSPAKLIHVTGDVVNIRKGPGTNYGIAKQVYQNDIIIVSHVTELLGRKWGKVENGWICLEYTDYNAVLQGTGDSKPENDSPQNGTHTNDDSSLSATETVSGLVRVNDLLRIRSGPGTDYSRIGYYFDGNRVEILEQKKDGSMVWGRTTRGWVCMDYIDADVPATDEATQPDSVPEEETEPEEETKPLQETKPDEDSTDSDNKTEALLLEGRICADALRIRSQPGTGYPIVGFYYQNDTVTVTEKTTVDSVCWGKTDRGWIHMDYFLAESPEDTQSPSDDGSKKTVIADCLRVRMEPSTDSKIAELLYYGDHVKVLNIKSVGETVWGRVENGWICMDYVH